MAAGAGFVQVRSPAQEFGCEISAVGPNCRLRLRVEPYLPEDIDVPQRLEHGSPEFLFEVNLARVTVSEEYADLITRDVLDSSDYDSRRILWKSAQSRGGIF